MSYLETILQRPIGMIPIMNTSKSRSETKEGMYEDDIDNKPKTVYKKTRFDKMLCLDDEEFGDFNSQKLDELAQNIKYWDSAARLYEEEKVEGDMQEASMRWQSLQNGWMDFEDQTNDHMTLSKNFGKLTSKINLTLFYRLWSRNQYLWTASRERRANRVKCALKPSYFSLILANQCL